jgi:hypothetical protein
MSAFLIGRYGRRVDLIRTHQDGGATVRLSKVELVRFYNLLNVFLNPATPQELEWAEKGGQIAVVHLLADLIGMPRPTYPPQATDAN